ncbi:DUF308 domain-containing protein [Duganella callida]|uniref:DUF308 domain-containing protein n=1 Tax=Duganella callida TaxID=2561932 RepID=A0A4Y9S5U1_9BURK|nr:DUF308 domain-containing protein [Duganella callida]TFW16731.1 DUF308 domain-containing protein [Duganella callida]
MVSKPAASEQRPAEQWLKQYYYARAAFAIAWVAAASTVAKDAWGVAAVLLVLYPLWDAVANFADAARSGGLARNRTQAGNVIASLIVTAAVALSLSDMHRVLAIFGAWAILSGLFQLGTGVRRWRTSGAQWTMILSGAQSALAGAFFIAQARMPAMPSIATITGYAGFGAFYFLLSALLLSVRARRA